MRDATVDSFVVLQSRRVRWLLAGWAGICLGAGAAGLSMQLLLAAGADDPAAWGVCAAVLAGAAAGAIAWRTCPVNAWHIEWQGQACRLSPLAGSAAACEGQLRPMIDLGSWLLLRFRATDGGCERWLTASARRMGQGWHPLRAALFRPDGALAAPPRG